MRTTLGLAQRCALPLIVLLLAYATGGASSAWAQAVRPAPAQRATPPQGNVAEAEQLFERAAAQMDAKNYEAASALLEQSNALDPSGGTLLNLGECYEQRGLTGSAYTAFDAAREISIRTGRTDRAEVAEARKKRLLPTLRRLTIVPPNAYPRSLAIQLDGKPLERSRWNQPLPVDPGEHRIQASADAHFAHATVVSALDAGTTTSVSIPPLQPRAPVGSGRQRGVDGQRVVAIASGVLGVASLTTGVAFGLRSLSKHRESDEHCGPTTCRDLEGVTLMEDARAAGNNSTVAFIVGGVACGAAAALWFAPPFGKGAAKPQIGLGPGAIRFAGRW